MSEPAKPFACSIPDCGMSFTNEDHLHVHTKKHDMVLQLGLEQKAAFVADQTPTPTRFIRNCEEVGLFQDLQNVTANPFDEGFKRAMETKAGILSLEATITQTSDDVLHTPQMVFPLLDSGETASYNAQRNITISRSSSDESGTIKEFETRTISKLTNEVTTISRIFNSDDVTVKQTDIQKDIETVSYKNNVIRIESNVIRKDVEKTPVMVYTDSFIKESTKNSVIDTNKLIPEKLPIMSQKSIDLVVDSLTSELDNQNAQPIIEKNKNDATAFTANKIDDQMAKLTKILTNKPIAPKKKITPRILPKKVKNFDGKSNDLTNGYEVVIKLPDGKQVRMKPVEEPTPKEVIRNRINKRLTGPPNILKRVTKVKNAPNVVKIPTGTLIPVTLVDKEGTPLSNNDLNNVPITKINKVSEIANIKLPMPFINTVEAKTCNTQKFKIVNKKTTAPVDSTELLIKVSEPYQMNVNNSEKTNVFETQDVLCVTEDMIKRKIEENSTKLDKEDDDCVVVEEVSQDPESIKMQRAELERRCAASRRYRERLKQAMRKQSEENRLLREINQKLVAEKAVLKLIITEHMKGCPNGSDIVNRLAVLTNGGSL